MISKEPRNTEDWSNGCWKLSFAMKVTNYILKH